MSHSEATKEPVKKRRMSISDITVDLSTLPHMSDKDKVQLCKPSDPSWKTWAENDSYLHLFLPKQMAIDFTNFLNNSAMALSQIDSKTVHIVDASTHSVNTSLSEKANSFATDFKKLKSSFSVEVSKFSDTALTDKLEHDEFLMFKDIRAKLTKWYRVSQHLANKIDHPSTSNDYLKLSYNFSPAVNDTTIKNQCVKDLSDLKHNVESHLTESVVDTATTLQSDVHQLFSSTFSTGDSKDRLIICKAMRTVFRGNRDLQYNGQSRRYRNYNQHRDGGQTYPKRFAREDRYHDRPRPFHEGYDRPRTFHDHGFQRDSHYDEDFPAYDPSVNTRRKRYVEDDEVFTRRPTRPYRNLSTRSSTTRWTKI